MELIPTLMESSNKAGHTPTAINIEAKATETIFSYLLASGRFSNFGSTGPTIVLAINLKIYTAVSQHLKRLMPLSIMKS